MARQTYTAKQKARAVELYAEHGLRGAVRLCNDEGIPCSAHAISRWATAAGVETRANDNRSAQVTATTLHYAERRLTLANSYGESADELRAITVASAREGNAELVRACATASGIFTDKAQLLTGGATGRDEHRFTPAAQLRDVTEARVRELRSLPA